MGKSAESTTKFKVDISELKKGMQEASRSIKLANSEFKAATAGMDNWANSADGVTAKTEQLKKVLENQKKQLSNLEEQYRLTAKEQGENSKGAVELAIKINNQKAAIGNTEKELNTYTQRLSDLETAQKEAADSAQEAATATEKLRSTISQQENDLKSLKKAYADVALEQGENTQEAKELASQIQKLSGELKESKTSLSKAEGAAEQFDQSMDEVADSAQEAATATEKSSGAFSGFAKSLAGVVAGGIKAAAGAVTGLAGAFLAAGEASQEYQEDMGKLNTAFDAAGHSAETAQKTYRDMVGILGETDQSVEAVNHLAKLTKSEEELAQWTDIAAGVYATFGDSLPLEGLTEAANETAKVGQVTGPLADALNWATESGEKFGVTLKANTKENEAWNKAVKEATSAEDYFNLALQECSSEQERAALITDTLNKMYSETGKTYQETNADLIAARQAQSDLSAAMAEVGQLATPITTSLKQMGVSLLTELLPSIKQVAEGFRQLFNGDIGGADQLGTAISELLTQALGKVTEILPTVAQVGVSIITSLINSLVSALPQMASTGTQILQTLVESIIAAAPQLLTAGQELITFLYDSIMTGIPRLIELGSQFLTNIGQGIAENLPNLVNTALDMINGFADMLTENLPILVESGIGFIKNLVQGIVESLPTLIEKVPEIITKFANLVNDNLPTILQAGIDILIELVKGIINSIPELVANIPKIFQAFVATWEAFNWLSLGKKAITFLKDGILSMLHAVGSAGKSVLNSITDVIKNLPKKLMDFGKNAVSDLGGAIRGGIHSVASAAGEIMSGILRKFSPNALVNVGKDLIRGLWNGISDMTGWIIDKIGGFAGSVVNSIKDFFGIHSPSRVMRDQIGKFLPEGLAEGIKRNAAVAVKAMQGMSKKIMPEAESMRNSLHNLWGDVRVPDIHGENRGHGGNGGGTVVQNFYQYNNSPKALSRLDIYRQTRNQLAFAKGV